MIDKNKQTFMTEDKKGKCSPRKFDEIKTSLKSTRRAVLII